MTGGDIRLALAVLLFALSDFALIATADDEVWFYAVDYAFRIAALIIVWPIFPGLMGIRGSFAGQTIFGPDRVVVALTTLLVLLLTVAILTSESLFGIHVPVLWEAEFRYARPDGGALLLIDATFGLALVAWSEEVVFRRLLLSRLSGLLPYAAALVCSSVLFGLIHWGLGSTNALMALLAGLLLGWLYLRYQRLWPVATVHYVANLVIYYL